MPVHRAAALVLGRRCRRDADARAGIARVAGDAVAGAEATLDALPSLAHGWRARGDLVAVADRQPVLRARRAARRDARARLAFVSAARAVGARRALVLARALAARIVIGGAITIN